MKNKMGKIAKFFALLSLIWLIIIYAIASDSYRFDMTGFIIFAILPLVIGWGIYWVMRK